MLPFLLGIVFLALAVRARRSESELRSSGVLVTGTVVDNQHESRAQGAVHYRPVVEFRTQANKKVRTVGDTPLRRAHLVGAKVEVRYDPKDPKRVLVGSGAARQYTVAAVVFFVFGSFAAWVIYEAFQVLSRAA